MGTDADLNNGRITTHFGHRSAPTVLTDSYLLQTSMTEIIRAANSGALFKGHPLHVSAYDERIDEDTPLRLKILMRDQIKNPQLVFELHSYEIGDGLFLQNCVNSTPTKQFALHCLAVAADLLIANGRGGERLSLNSKKGGSFDGHAVWQKLGAIPDDTKLIGQDISGIDGYVRMNIPFERLLEIRDLVFPTPESRPFSSRCFAPENAITPTVPLLDRQLMPLPASEAADGVLHRRRPTSGLCNSQG